MNEELNGDDIQLTPAQMEEQDRIWDKIQKEGLDYIKKPLPGQPKSMKARQDAREKKGD